MFFKVLVYQLRCRPDDQYTIGMFLTGLKTYTGVRLILSTLN